LSGCIALSWHLSANEKQETLPPSRMIGREWLSWLLLANELPPLLLIGCIALSWRLSANERQEPLPPTQLIGRE